MQKEAKETHPESNPRRVCVCWNEGGDINLGDKGSGREEGWKWEPLFVFTDVTKCVILMLLQPASKRVCFLWCLVYLHDLKTCVCARVC